MLMVNNTHRKNEGRDEVEDKAPEPRESHDASRGTRQCRHRCPAVVEHRGILSQRLLTVGHTVSWNIKSVNCESVNFSAIHLYYIDILYCINMFSNSRNFPSLSSLKNLSYIDLLYLPILIYRHVFGKV